MTRDEQAETVQRAISALEKRLASIPRTRSGRVKPAWRGEHINLTTQLRVQQRQLERLQDGEEQRP